MLGQPPLAAFGHGHGVETPAVQRAGQFAGDGAGVVGIVDGDVSHRQPPGPQTLGVVSHGGEDQGDLLLVVADIGRLVAHLGHQKGVGGRVQPVQRAQIVRQLVAQHQSQNRHARLRRHRVRAKRKNGPDRLARPVFICVPTWSGRGDSNARPQPWQCWGSAFPGFSGRSKNQLFILFYIGFLVYPVTERFARFHLSW